MSLVVCDEYEEGMLMIISYCVPVAERWKREVRWQEGLLSSQEECAIFHVVDMPQNSKEDFSHGMPRQSGMKPADNEDT